jgi:hypothetical protein
MIALKKEPEATKCSDHCPVSLTAHSAKTVAWILQRIIRTTELYFEKISLDSEKEKELGMQLGC